MFFDLCKNSQKPKLEAHSKMNYLLKYHHDCMREKVVPLPILFKVRNKRLALKGYRLNEGLCESLKHAFAIYPELLTGITLHDNGIADQDLGKIFQGLGSLEIVKEISVANNIFQFEAFEHLRPILHRVVPHNLEELRLISIRTGPLVTGQITRALAEGCHLRKLSLVNAHLSDTNMRELCDIIKHARFLVELDISANKMTPQRMLDLTRVLAANRQLNIINLSWNFFTQYLPMRDYIQGVDGELLHNEQEYVPEKDKIIN